MDELFVLVILSITILLVASLNSICIYIIVRRKKLFQQKPSTLLVLSLLTMHLLQAFLVMPFYAFYEIKGNLRSSIVCTGFRLFYLITFYMGVFNVFMISIDRFLALRLKTRYKNLITSKRTFIMFFCMWIYVIAICLIPFENNTKICAYNPQNQWILFMLLANCALPYMLTVVLYGYILYVLQKYSSKLSNNDNRSINHSANNSNNINGKKSRKSKKQSNTSNTRITRNTMILISTYGLTWTPSIIYFTLEELSPDVFPATYKGSTAEEYVFFFMLYIKFVEGIASPIIYCYLNGYYKRIIRKLCCSKGDDIPKTNTSKTKSVTSSSLTV